MFHSALPGILMRILPNILLYVVNNNFYYTQWLDDFFFLKKCYNNNINNDLFLFGLPGVMIIVKLWVHTSVKWKLSWGWESHCVVSISRDPNSSSNLSKFSWGLRRLRPQTSQICPINPTSVPKSPTVTLSNIWWEDI